MSGTTSGQRVMLMVISERGFSFLDTYGITQVMWYISYTALLIISLWENEMLSLT